MKSHSNRENIACAPRIQPGKQHVMLLVFLLSFISDLAITVNGQSLESPSVVLPAPRSREFQKFIDYKVSLYNGLAETNLNFYTIELDGLRLPISISYHGSGIKYGQTSGDVGLGWQLKPDFRVSRTVYGRLDESSTMPDMKNVSGGQAIIPYLSSGFATPFARDQYLAGYFNISPGADIPAISTSPSNYLDGQFDMFTIGLPTENGNFIITDRTNKVVTPLNNATLNKINYSIASGLINEFLVTDKDANKYKFGAPDSNNEGRQVNVNGTNVKYNTAWMLSEITTPFSNTITLGYQTIQETSRSLPIFSQAILEGKTFTAPSPLCYPTVADLIGSVSPASSTNYDSKILSTISTPNEVVTFNRNANGTVGSIVVARPNGTQIKKVTFIYDGSFLDQIQIVGTDNAIIGKYVFTYTSKNVSFQNYDSFGYGAQYTPGASQAVANTYGRVDYLNVTQNLCDENGSFLNLTGEDKRVVPTLDDGMLKKIKFPTGGTREFFYESNRYNLGSSTTVVIKGGFRISAITDTDPTTGNAVTRQYTYGKGVRMVDPTDPSFGLNQRFVLAYNNAGSVGTVHALKRTNYSSIIDSEVASTALQSNNGWYENVTETFSEGKVEYTYEIPHQYSNAITYPTNSGVSSIQFPAMYMSAFHPWSTPVLKQAVTYSGTSSYNQVRKEIYEYYVPNPSPAEEFIGLSVSPFAVIRPGFNLSVQTSAPSFSLYDNSGIQSVFNYGTLTITKGDVLLKKKSVTDYAPSGASTTSSSEYEYTDYNLIGSEKKTTSKGQIELIKYKYPFNYTGLTQTDNFSAGIKNLSTINMLTPAIETSRYLQSSDGSNSKLYASEFRSFKNTLPVADKFFGLNINSPVTDFVESTIISGAVTKDNRYEEQMSFDVYNSKGKIQQRGKPGDTKEVYLWGYNNQYPVARIAGADYLTASGLVNQSILDATSTTDAAMRTELNKLRALSNAQVYTYTYSPLVGMTSETDRAGKTTFFEYDHYNRLSVIKNASGLVIATYCYNYVGQLVECSSLSPFGTVTASTLQVWGDPPLPVAIIDFKATKVEKEVQLNWSTSAETNSDHFEVQRSDDGKHWERIGVVEATGESVNDVRYDFIDNSPRKGENLYRLKMVDKGETFAYSRIRSITIDKEGNVVLYPNPITIGQKLNLLTDDLSVIAKISFVSVTGITVLETATPRTEINTSSLAVGLYTVIVTYKDGTSSTQRIVKQ